MKTLTSLFRKNLKLLLMIIAVLLVFIARSHAVLTQYANQPILACGAQHAIMLKSDGTVWTWWGGGDDNYGQMGQQSLPSTYANSYLVPDRETNILGATAVAAGDFFSLVLKWNGTVLAFGRNNEGQLGIGNTSNTNKPTLVTNLTGVAAIAAGSDFSMALLSNGTVEAWGDNGSGQLGIGSTSPSHVNYPTNVVGLHNIVAISCGYRHALALDSSGYVWAWGDNSSGELGDGTTTARSSPVQVVAPGYEPPLWPYLSGVYVIAAGGDCSFAVTTNVDNIIQSAVTLGWGSASDGRLGMGSGFPSHTNAPTQIPGLTNICLINAAGALANAVDTSGQLWKWGQGYYDISSSTTPTNIASLSNIEFIGSFGPKKADTDFQLFEAVLDGTSNLRQWGAVSEGGGSTYSPFNGPTMTNIDWGYNDSFTESPVEPDAYYRGDSSRADFASFVIPLDLQKGVALDEIGGVATNLLPFVTNYPINYHWPAVDSDYYIEYQNPVASFGSRVGGSPLYTDRSYRFVLYGGCPAMINDYPMLTNYDNALEIEIYSKTNYSLVGVTNFPIPFYLATNGSWALYLTNGLTTSLNAFGLTTTLSTLSYPNAYGVTNNGTLQLSHLASDAATNYIYVIKVKGMCANGLFFTDWLSFNIYDGGQPAWDPLYTLEFQPSPPWNIRFLSQIQFQNEPLPPFYDGKSLDELLTNSWTVTNVINLPYSIASYTNVDDSPELRSSPILDDFVSQLKNDPLAIARYVQNEIELTDAIDYLGNNEITTGQLNLGGINRSALGVFQERQGSPAEQCALLIYMLRKAGVPAVYAFPPTNGIKMLDTRLSNMLRVQLNGAIDPNTGAVNTNTLISVNYPWVAAYINNQWVNLFPWIKDTEIIQGPNLYDYMPTNYNNAMDWVVGYLYGRPEILGLGDTNDPPEILFPRYVEQQLLTNAPGISFDQLGIQAVNRPHPYPSWNDFPTPTWGAGTNLVAESLSDPVVTNPSFTTWNPNIFPANHIFNTADIQVLNDGTNLMDTSTIRCCDIHDRSFLIYCERTNSSNKGLRIKMNLAAYKPSITNIMAFTNDSLLLSNEVQTVVLSTSSKYTNMSINVTLTRYRTAGSPDVITQSMPIKIGDLNALCLNFGRVSEEMLEPLAQTVWDEEDQIKQNPAVTNSLTVDQYQGPLIYLMGMSYYQKVDHFIPVNAQIHGRTPVTDIGIGLAKLICKNTTPGELPSGPIVYNQPCVDMAYNERTMAEAPTALAQSGAELNYANDSFNILTIADGSAKEHVTINDFFNQVDSVSTVKLLQLAAERHTSNPTKYKDILIVNQNNVLSDQTNSYFPASIDLAIWGNIESAVLTSPDSQAFVTPGNTTNNTDSYDGTGALIINNNQGSYAALISGTANGGWGAYIPDDSFMDDNLVNDWLGTDGDGNYSENFTVPSTDFEPLAFDNFDPSQTLNIINDADANFLQYTPVNTDWAFQTAGYLGSASQPLNDVFANAVLESQNAGFLGFLSDALGQAWSAVKDPVHVVTGEFFVDTVDLTLVGPLPLEIRRNYSSLNLANNEFGTGWKLSFTPYISVATNGTEMYAAEPDGSVLAYTISTTNADVWIPTLSQNPQLVNNRKEGIGSTANLLLSKIVETNQSGITNFYLYSPNGDVRNYQVESFSISNVIDRTRPYLITWLDARGNSLNFSYGTNSQATDYGQLARVNSSSGAYIQFTYDIDGHILRALSNDGREVDYQYDDYGDLVTVTLPDASEIDYQYGHGYQPVTNSYTANGKNYKSIVQQPYSFHLLTTKTDPDGRILENAYDSQRRVIAQVSTVGADDALVTNATFVYSNNFVLTNSDTNTISGYTLLADVFGNVTRYDYTNSRITLITDPLSQTVEQDWYDENTNLPGYYPRSLWKIKDKRGLWTTFQYDSFGNITNTITSGNLTGQGGTQIVTNITFYNTNNLPIVVIDALGNSNVFSYDSVFSFLPRQLVAYRQGQAVTTNEIFYGSSTNVVALGNTLWTNMAFGLPQLLVRAYNSPDAASNQWFYNGSGFVTNEIDYTSTTDPAITNALFYDGRGELYQAIDAAGRSYSYDYDGLGRIISEEAFEAGQTTPMSWQNYYYDHNGDITWYDGPQYNPEDYVWYDYDGAGRKVSEVHWRSQAAPDGSGVQAASGNSQYSITSYEYDAFGNLIKQVDPVGNYSIMAYDKIGQMTQKVFYDANNNALATNLMSHEPGGEVANFTNSLGGVTQTLYTQTGKPYFRQNPNGSTNGWQYDLLGRVQKEFLPNGSYWQTTYDDAHRTITRQFYNSSSMVLATTVNVSDRRGNLITNITAQGGVFFNAYDGQDRLKVAGGPAASGTSAQQVNYTYYDSAGVSVTNIDSVGRETVITYDATERPLSTQTYDLMNGGALISSQTTSYSPDHHAVIVTVGTGGNAISRTTFLDSFYNPVLTQVYPNSTTNFAITSYDLAERVATNQDELDQITSFTYDGLGRVSIKQLPDGATVVNSYNGEGGLTSMVMPGGLTWSGVYNSANQLIGEQLANGASIERQFTNIFYTSGPMAGLLQSATDLGRSVTVAFTYDDFRRVSASSAIGLQPAQTLATTYQYDSGGWITNYIQTSGVNPTTSVNRFFDGYGQITNEQIYIGGVLQNSFAQNWDAAGRRSLLQSPTAAFNYAYRADGLMSGVTAFGSIYSFSYTNNGLLIARSNPWRTLTVNSRDGQGRLLEQTATVGSGNPLVENLTWRPDSTLNSYAATRTGTESWNDNRTYQYNSRGQLTKEPIGVNSSTLATNTYTFDSSLLGVLVGAQWSGGLTNNWQGSLDAFSQIDSESWNEASVTLRADGSAWNASSASASLDGSAVSTSLGSGRWYSDLTLSPGSHSLSASAYYPAGQFGMSVTNNFTVLGANNVTDYYDGAGFVTNRIFASGKTQALTWDAAGRLVALTQWNNSTNGFFWAAIYDSLGRRLRTTYVPVVNGYTNTAGTLTLDSYFDPQVEFEEVGVAVNGQRTWKVLGPDLDGHYGSLHGVGGLEATVRESDGLTTPVLNDYFGNVLATISGTTTSWSPVRVGGYGPVLGYQSPTLTASTLLADTLVWRSRGIDPSGFYNLGARYYDPVAGHFLSADPLGHASSMDLYSFCGGDPINQFDPTGRFGKDVINGNFGNLGNDIANGFSNFRENLGQFDLAYGDQIQQTFMAIDLAAASFVVPEIAGGLLEEGFGLEAGAVADAGIAGEGFDVGAEASVARETEMALPETETALSTETEALPAEAESVSEPALANTFTESGQDEFGFVKGLDSAPAQSATAQSSVGASQISQSAATESSIGTSQASQSVLNSAGAGSINAAEETQTAQTLFHYTDEQGLSGILDSGELNPSLKALNPNDVRYGNGQYLSDIVPGTMTPAQLSRQFLGQPFQGAKYTSYIEIDVSGLNVIQGRPGVFVIPGETPLDLTGRIISSGKVQ
ncbi:MAG TPA: HYD1 signature containing ADP-ribosyltransferase family protein [Verrucomicrobiae bacterium]|nr:HYD1 signature containing ADP-ribosyltransferase family protein [Verrucomicrobiae bacterium]